MSLFNYLLSIIFALTQKIADLTSQLKTLSSKLQEAEAQKEDLSRQIADLNTLTEGLQEQTAGLLSRVYGRQSEKSKNIRHAEAAAELCPDLQDTNSRQKEKNDSQRKRKPKETGHKDKILAHLPTEEIIHRLEESERICEKCGEAMPSIGIKPVHDEVVYVPARLIRRRILKESYACPCQCSAIEAKKIVGPAVPKLPIPTSYASPSLLAQLIHQKFSLSVPVYRQADDWRRFGLPTPVRTLYNWINSTAENLLDPLYKRFHSLLMDEEILHADETTFKINKDDKDRQLPTKSYIWIIRTTKGAGHPIIYYQPERGRGAKEAKGLLDHFEGYLHVDGHSAYRQLPGSIILVGCLGHLRRYFFEAVEIAGKGAAAKGLWFCNQIFKLERDFAKSHPEEIYQLRQKHSKPVLEEMYSWLDSLENIGNGKFAKAVTYALNQKEYFMNIFLDGRLQASNNLIETMVKPIALGRKNFLFADSQVGAKANGLYHTFVETAEANGIDPYNIWSFFLKNSLTPKITSRQRFWILFCLGLNKSKNPAQKQYALRQK